MVRHQGHHLGLLAIWLLFRLSPRHLRTGLGWANDTIRLSTHGTTHVDAPWHYAPTSAGQPARSPASDTRPCPTAPVAPLIRLTQS
jgi:hypothetical protein